jgi:thiamine-phosphate pyrophosphorylase
MWCMCSRRFAGGRPSLKAAARNNIVCYVTDRKSLISTPSDSGSVDLVATIRMALDAGVDWIQIREKDLSARELLELASQVVPMANQYRGKAQQPARIIVNERLDVALAAGAHGVHLGQASLLAGEVVRWCRAGNAPIDFRIGVSCHSLEEVRRAEKAKVDYIFFGPIFETPSKKEFGAPQGIQKLAEVCRAFPRLDVIAIGGVDTENAATCIRAGAAGIAAIRMFQEPGDTNAVKETVASVHEPDAKEESR